jgi:phospholipase/carboxylesterase
MNGRPALAGAATLALVAAASGLVYVRSRGDGTTKEKRAQLTFLEDGHARGLANASADETSPVVVGIHGRGDTPESFSDLFHAYGGRARFVFPRAEEPYDEGFTWFSLAKGMDERTVAENVGRAAEALHARLAPLVGTRRYVVVGFSQGGFLSYALAAKYPSEIACALPVAGALPAPLRPATWPSVRPRILAFHGEDDRIVAVEWDRATQSELLRAGADVHLTTYPGLGHRTSPELRRALYDELDRCLSLVR